MPNTPTPPPAQAPGDGEMMTEQEQALNELIILAMERDPQFIALLTRRDCADIDHGASARKLWRHYAARDIGAYLTEFRRFEELRVLNQNAHQEFHDWLAAYLEKARSTNA